MNYTTLIYLLALGVSCSMGWFLTFMSLAVDETYDGKRLRPMLLLSVFWAGVYLTLSLLSLFLKEPRP